MKHLYISVLILLLLTACHKKKVADPNCFRGVVVDQTSCSGDKTMVISIVDGRMIGGQWDMPKEPDSSYFSFGTAVACHNVPDSLQVVGKSFYFYCPPENIHEIIYNCPPPSRGAPRITIEPTEFRLTACW